MAKTVGKPFKKGQSGNPGGKSPVREELRRQFETIVNEHRITEKGKGSRPCFEVVVERVILEASEGKAWACQLLFDKVLGKAKA